MANITFAFLLLSMVCNAQPSFDTLIARAKEKLYANDYHRAMELYNICLKEAQRLNDGFKIGNSYIGIGICYDKSTDYEHALINYFKALPAYESVGNLKKQAGTLKNIGNTYRSIKSYDKALDFFQQASARYREKKDSAGLSNVMNDLGLLYMDQEKFDTAISYFTEVITTYKKYAVKEVNGYALNNLGLVYSKKQNYAAAQNYYSAALQAMRTMDNDYGVALVLANMGNLYNRLKHFPQGLSYSQQGLALARSIHSKELVANTYEDIAFAYRQLADYKQSNDYLDKLLLLRDTIFKEESAKSYAEMETRYQNEKKQKEIILLKKDNAIKDLDITNQRRTRTFLIITLCLIVIIAAIIYRSYAAKQQLNKALNIVNDKLNEANQSKTKLLGIITHDLRTPVSSLFSFLQLQRSAPGRLTAEQQDKYNTQINAAAENVLSTMEDVLTWSKSQMEKFEPVIERVEMGEFCEEILNLNQAAAGNKSIQLIKKCRQDIYLQTDPNFLKIILRNLVGNAVKFTPAGGTVELVVQQDKDAVTIAVKDNGGGIPPGHIATIFEWNSIRSDSSGLGLRLAKEFTEKLNGSITVRSVTGEGAEFMLAFKNFQ